PRDVRAGGVFRREAAVQRGRRLVPSGSGPRPHGAHPSGRGSVRATPRRQRHPRTRHAGAGLPRGPEAVSGPTPGTGSGFILTPLVSVIVPVWNGRRYLEEALESVATQDYHPVEMVVVDDGSEDDSAHIAARYATRLIRRPAQGGVAVARNEAIRAARGAILACLDQDDRWEPSTLRTHVRVLSTYPEAISVVWERLYVEPGCQTPSWLGRPELLAHAHAAF